MFVTSLCVFALVSAQTPQHAINITVYHVGQANYTSLADQNAGDPLGDMDFMLRAAGLPYLCSNASGEARYTYDCGDTEQTADDLVVSQTILEVDSRWSEYAECNVADGVYSCECRNQSAAAHHQHHHQWPLVTCNATVGKIAVVNESGYAHEFPDPSDPYSSSYRYYFYNAAQKFGGSWYSTLSSGECGNPAARFNNLTSHCAWRTVQRVKRVSKQCQENHVFATIQKHDSGCFDACPQPLDRTKACWTQCIYDTVFGPNSNRTAYPANTTQGMPTQQLVDAWLRPFSSSDPADGGCPNIPF